MHSSILLFRNFGVSALVAVSLHLGLPSAKAASLTWNNGNGTWDLSTPLWMNGAGSVTWTDVTTSGTDTAVFADPAGSVELDTTVSALGLQFTSVAGGYTISGAGTLNLGSGGIDASLQTSGVTAISNAITLAAAQSWNVGAGATLSASGVISGTSALTKTGAGTLTLSNANTYSGGTTLTSGTLILNNGSSDNTAASAIGIGTLALNGGTIDSTVGGVTLGTNNPITIGNSFTFAGSNNLNLGSGAVGVTGNYTITSNANTLTMGGGISSSTAGVKILTLRGSGNTVVSGSVGNGSGVMNLQKFDTGTLTLSGGASIGSATGGQGISNGGSTSLSAMLLGGTTSIISGTYTSANEVVVGGVLSNGGAGVNTNLTMSSGTLTIAGYLSLGRGNGIGVVSSDIVLNNSAAISSSNFSGGFNGGNAANLPKGTFTLNNTSSFTVATNGVFNLAESPGSNMTMTLNDSATVTVNGVGSTTNRNIGNLGVGTLTINGAGASFTDNSTNTTNVGYQSGTGTLNVNAGTFNHANGEMVVAGSQANGTFSGAGTINVAGGTLTTKALTIGRNANDVASSLNGAVNVTSGTLNVTAAQTLVGWRGIGTNGTLNISGGTFNQGTTATANMSIGSFTGANGAVNVSSGALNYENNSSLRFADTAGSGTSNRTLTIGGGAVTFYSDAGSTAGGTGFIDLMVTANASGTNTINLNGGTLAANQIKASSATGTRVINFNGGTLKSSGTSLASTFLASNVATTANVRNGGAIIDTNGNNVTIGQVLTHSSIGGDNATDGGLTKQGAGTLTLTGLNTFNGNTVISSGTLLLGNSGALQNSTLNYNNQGGVLSFGALTSSTFGGLSGAGNLALSNTSSAAVAFTVGSNNGNTTYSGVLSGGASVTKIGTGTLTLAGANSYSGGTTISGGTLQLGDGTSLNGSVTGNITNNGALAFANPNAQTYSGIIGGNGSVTKTGNGILTLTATSSYSGGTTISAGTLQLGDGASINGVIVGNVSNGGTLAFANPAAQTFGGKISGLGGLTKSGYGTLTLTGSNTYTGSTTVNAGTLVFSGNQAITGAISTADAANLKVVLGSAGAATLTPASLTLGSTGANASTVTMDLNNLANPTTAPVSMSGPLTLIGNVTLGVANPGNLTNGSFNLFSAGSIAGTFANSTIQFGARSTGNIGYTSTAVTMDVSTDSITWSGANGGTWVTSGTGDNSNGNWATVTGKTTTSFWLNDIVKFGDTYDTTSSGGGLNSLTSPQTVTVSGTVSPVSVAFNNSQVNYTIAGSGTLTGSTGVTLNGTGAVTISTANDYSGGTTLNSGTFNINNTSAIGTGVLTIAGGILDNTSGAAITLSANNAQNWNGSFGFTGTKDLNLGAGVVTLGASPTVAVNAGTLTVGGGITGSFGLTKSGTGTLLLAGASTYSGGTTISAGRLKVGNATALGANGSAVSVSSGAALDLNGTTMTGLNALTLSGSGISNGGVLTNSSATAGTYAGLISLGSSSSIVASNGNIILSNAGTITGSGNLTLDGAANGSSIASNISTGAGSVIKNGAGTWTLSGSSTYSGGTTLNAGTLQFSNGSALGTGTLTSNGGTLKWSYVSGNASFANNLVVNAATTLDVSGGNWNFNGNISGNGAINRGTSANLTLYLGGDDSLYTGTFTSPNNGNAVVRFNSASAGSAGASWVFNNTTVGRSTLSWTGTGTISFGSLTGGGQIQADVSGAKTISVGALGLNDTFSGTIANGLGTVALTKVGIGNMTLTGNNSFSGGANVNNGTLTVNGVNSGNGVVSVASGATLAGSGTLAGSALVNGSLMGSLTVAGVTVNDGGSVAPGTSTPGILTDSNGISFSGSNASLSIVVGKTTAFGNAPTAGVDYSQLNLPAGGVSLNNATLNLSGAATNLAPNDLLFIILNSSGSTVGGTFNGLADQSQFTVLNGVTFEISYTAGTDLASFIGGGNNVALEVIAVPEPSTWAMLISGLGLLSFWQRNRRKSV